LSFFTSTSVTLQRKVRLKAAAVRCAKTQYPYLGIHTHIWAYIPGGVLLENACAGESAQNGYGAGSNLAL
jgi:hypothetical protein